MPVESIDLRSILVTVPSISADTRLDEAAMMLGRSEHEFVVVKEGATSLGVCSQARLSQLMVARFGHAIYGRSTVREHLDEDLMTVRIDQPLLEILDHAFSRPEQNVWKDVVVVDGNDGIIGLFKAHDLARLQSALVAEKISHLEQRQEELVQANVSLTAMAEQLRASNLELAVARDKGLQAARAKSEFLAVMSHEIRTPLNGILGMVSLLRDARLDEDQSDLVDAAHVSAEALLHILNDILDFSRLEAGKVPIEHVPFSLRELTDSVLTLFAERAIENGIEVICDIEPDIPDRLLGDVGRIRQILNNLVGNAVKFTDKGEVALRIRKVAGGPAACELLCEVIDTGIGISAADQATLFNPFSQGDSSTTRKYGGTGLGLAICRKLIEAMGGEIGLTSAIGVGSTFWFRLPIELSQVVVNGYEPLSVSRETVALALVQSRTLANSLAKELGFRRISPLIAGSAEQALEILGTGSCPVDLLLVEARFWKEQIRERTQRCPTIVIYDFHGESAQAIRTGALHICKPIRLMQFDRALQKALEDGAPAAARQPQKAETRGALPSTESKPRSSKGKVLIVEDNPINRRLATKFVSDLGYESEQAENGLQALKISETTAYEVILLDCRMPEMDGYEFSRWLREREAADDELAQPAYLIALTANAMEGDRELCYAAGMNAYLTKPLRKPELREMLEIGFSVSRGALARNLAV